MKDANGDYNKLSPEWKLAFGLIHAGYNNRHKEEMNKDHFIEFLEGMHNGKSKGGSKNKGKPLSEAGKLSVTWNALHNRKTQEEIDLLHELKDIIEPVVNSIKFSKSDKLGGANDKLLEDNLLAVLRKFDKTNPTNVKILSWTNQKGQDYKKSTTDKRGSISGDKVYFNRQLYVVTCNSVTLGRGLVANSRALIEMQVIIRILLNAEITHHRESTEAKRKEYIKDLMKTVLERDDKKLLEGDKLEDEGKFVWLSCAT